MYNGSKKPVGRKRVSDGEETRRLGFCVNESRWKQFVEKSTELRVDGSELFRFMCDRFLNRIERGQRGLKVR